MDNPIIGLMLGDVTGIGPEVAAKLLARKETHDQARVAVIGDRRLLELGMRDAGLTLPVRVHKSLADIDWGDASIHCIDLGNTDPAQYQRGAVSLAHATLKAFGFAAPRIGVAALNPHAGESGLFGDEEIRVIRPTLKQLADQGIATQGPLPSDTVFLKAARGEPDAVVIMYHDQG